MRMRQVRWLLGTTAFCVVSSTIAEGAEASAGSAEGIAGKASHRRLYSTTGEFGTLEVTEAQGIRYLFVDGIIQTAMYADRTRVARECHLLAKRYWLELLPCFRPDGRRCLLIGLGGGLLPAVLKGYGVETQGVEVDPKVLDVARRYFGYKQPASLSDGREYLVRSAGRFDFVVIDAFAGASLPYHLVTRQCFELAKARLEPSGILAVNLISRPSKSRVCASVVRTLGEVFPHVAAYRTDRSDVVQSIICFASSSPLEASIHPHGRGLGLTSSELESTEQYIVKLSPSNGVALTDGENPVAEDWSRETQEWREKMMKLFGRSRQESGG